jgi:hypothetical protein
LLCRHLGLLNPRLLAGLERLLVLLLRPLHRVTTADNATEKLLHLSILLLGFPLGFGVGPFCRFLVFLSSLGLVPSGDVPDPVTNLI